MLLQSYLRNGGTIEALKNMFAIKATRSERLPSLYLFKYDQINSPFTELLVRECRGVILDSENNWNVVCRPFDKFFNLGEQLAAPIDWSTARIQEKLDGSLMTMYHYQDDWHVSSSGNPDAAGNVNAWPMDFANLFWDTWFATKMYSKALHPAFNYMFELTSPYNMVVVPHVEPKLTLIGVRHVATGHEFSPLDYKDEFPLASTYPMSSFDDVLASFSKLDGQRFEGYVVVDANYNRVKVKHPQYVALHHLKDSVGASPKRLVEIIRKNESEEFLTYFPEFKERFLAYKEKYNNLVYQMEFEWDNIVERQQWVGIKFDRKQFAFYAKEGICPAFLFQRFDNRVDTAREFLANVQIDQLMAYLEK
jgi:T4 RnlA family RNA ligase